VAAYVIVNIEIVDRERYAEYIQAAPASIAAYGGRYLVRGGRAELLEGSWQPKRVAMLEFETLDRAKEWWASEEYRAAKALRQACARADMIVVEGL
jgi:uncharacterized protein (DUF1330 family)